MMVRRELTGETLSFLFTLFHSGGGGGGGYSHIFPIQGRYDRQGIIFRVLCLKQGIQFQIFVS